MTAKNEVETSAAKTYKETSIGRIAELLRKFKKTDDYSCVLLIGAGCSISAGIPLASEMVKTIKEENPNLFKEFPSDNYQKCMSQLLPVEQRLFIKKVLKDRKVNWAHIVMGQLMQHDYVDRVLTINFDNLILRAAMLAGFIPAVYDLASTHTLDTRYIADKAVFYLHGQETGFIHIHDDKTEEGQGITPALQTLFEDSNKKRMWIVVGYSGESDDIFPILQKIKGFDCSLFWVGHGKEPSGKLKEWFEDPANKDNNAYFLGGQDADKFFINLGVQLAKAEEKDNIKAEDRVFLPRWMAQPFSYLQKITQDTITSNNEEMQEPMQSFAHILARAINEVENSEEGQKLKDELEKISTNEKRAAAWEEIEKGNQLFEAAQIHITESENAKAHDLFKESYTHYKEALNIIPKMHEALNNWGVTLCNEAQLYFSENQKEDAQQLFKESYERHQEALKIKPKDFSVQCNLACLYAVQNDVENCKNELLKAHQLKALNRQQLADEKDFNSVREMPWFLAFLETLPKGV